MVFVLVALVGILAVFWVRLMIWAVRVDLRELSVARLARKVRMSAERFLATGQEDP